MFEKIKALPLVHKFTYSLYVSLIALLIPFLFLRLFVKSFKSPAYRYRWKERLGFFRYGFKHGGICIHAVSVGEVICAIPLIKLLKKENPDLPITVTSTTPSGSERVRALLGQSVFHVYLPFDFPIFVHNFFSKIKPSTFVVMETELWPTTINYCKKKNIEFIVANARLSKKSFLSYKKIAPLMNSTIDYIKVAAQHKSDADNFKKLGVIDANLITTGSVKFDVDVKPSVLEQAKKYKSQFFDGGKNFVWIAASTHNGEEGKILFAHRQLLEKNPNLLLVLAPRHPERSLQISNLLKQQGFCFQLESDSQPLKESTEVLLVDSIGKLMAFYGASDLSFVGGSFVKKGGHNPIEPAFWGLPIISGPSFFNFSDISKKLIDAGAMQVVDDSSQLIENILYYLNYPAHIEISKNSALNVIDKNKGAINKLFNLIEQSIEKT